MDNTYFQKGTEVEISCDDEGFRGAWYSGTVVRPATASNKTVLVQYNHLMADENGSMPLRESVDVVQLRPRAPRESSRVFRFSEEVDAYYNDGWWEGVITKVMDDTRCSVFFRGSRDQLDFQQSDLRLHREWVYGKWIPPLEEEKPRFVAKEKSRSRSKAAFTEGSLVEVRSDEDGFQGAWFSATILKCLGNDRFLVQYCSLRTDDDKEFLREEVDNLHLRPFPPESLILDCFSEHEEVDALYNDGWWVGVVSEVRNNSRYMVYFKGTDDFMEFKDSDLRLHQEWIDGKWVRASKVYLCALTSVWTALVSRIC